VQRESVEVRSGFARGLARKRDPCVEGRGDGHSLLGRGREHVLMRAAGHNVDHLRVVSRCLAGIGATAVGIITITVVFVFVFFFVVVAGVAVAVTIVITVTVPEVVAVDHAFAGAPAAGKPCRTGRCG
jgi:hypothetical protein